MDGGALLVLAINPGHDGAVAVVRDRELVLSLEAEKDSCPRHSRVTPFPLLDAAEPLEEVPDMVAIGGWLKNPPSVTPSIACGYWEPLDKKHEERRFFGRPVTMFSSSHVRSHIMSAVGMAPRDDATTRAVLVWEGLAGSFYMLDERFEVTGEIPVLTHPGNRYAFLFALADPTFPDSGSIPRNSDAGKLMALAAFGDAADANEAVHETVERILTIPNLIIAPKASFHDSPLYNAGVESEVHKVAAALLTERIFSMFAEVAQAFVPAGIPLHIGGGCGLNCDWNFMWRELGHFSSVFVPPCANDAGSSIGHAIDALHFRTGDPYIDWSVYSGREFERDVEPDPAKWRRRALDERELAQALAGGQVIAWVQGRWEIGPRALGNRSLLAEPFNPQTREHLNEIKRREGYRPIAPCCRVEDLGLAFNETFEDPYMLYFRTVRSDEFGAVTHVDGSARCQTVTGESNPVLHRLLGAFSELTGYGMLCNTSLNYRGRGFINRMSDLVAYSENRSLGGMVVGDDWFERVPQ